MDSPPLSILASEFDFGGNDIMDSIACYLAPASPTMLNSAKEAMPPPCRKPKIASSIISNFDKLSCPVPSCILKTFARASVLKRHWVETHFCNMECYCCPFPPCLYHTTRLPDLKVHLAIHTSSKELVDDKMLQVKTTIWTNPKYVAPNNVPCPFPDIKNPQRILTSVPHPRVSDDTNAPPSKRQALLPTPQLQPLSPPPTSLADIQPSFYEEAPRKVIFGEPAAEQAVQQWLESLPVDQPVRAKNTNLHFLETFPKTASDCDGRQKLLDGIKEADVILNHFGKRRDTLKLKLKKIEFLELEQLKKEVATLRREKADLGERLVAVRHLREKAESTLSAITGERTTTIEY